MTRVTIQGLDERSPWLVDRAVYALKDAFARDLEIGKEHGIHHHWPGSDMYIDIWRTPKGYTLQCGELPREQEQD